MCQPGSRAPRRVPLHDLLGNFERENHSTKSWRVALLAVLVHARARVAIHSSLAIGRSREPAHVEVDVAARRVGKTALLERPDHRLHLFDVLGGAAGHRRRLVRSAAQSRKNASSY